MIHYTVKRQLNKTIIILLLVVIIFILIIYYEAKLAHLKQFSIPNLNKIQSTNIISSSSSLLKSDEQGINKDLIIIYNRVPKTGSTSFMGIIYDLCNQNHFNVMHLNTSKNSHVMTLSDQLRFVWNITKWTNRQPSFIHGHIAFINFEKYGLNVPKPLYINIIRRPLDRLVSYYYFLRYGDNFRPNVIRRRQGNKRTFDECVEKNEHDCRLENLWLQIPFFCGQNPDCWKPGNKWALEQAKRNLVEHYFLVGVTEHIDEFVQILEISLPQIFKGSTFLYDQGNKSHLRKTFNKTAPSSRTIAKIKQSRVWQMENDFYHFALYNFNFIKEKIQSTGMLSMKYYTNNNNNNNRTFYEDKQQFFFEKIRPRSIS